MIRKHSGGRWGRGGARPWALGLALGLGGVLAGPSVASRGQAPAPEAAPGAGPVVQAPDPSTRYRFTERYAGPADGARDGELTQYRVASRDVIKVVTDKPQGAPDRSERSVQVIYTERPVVVNSQGLVTDAVRRYDALRVAPAPEGRPSAPRPLEGLTVWYRSRPGLPPALISLVESRSLTETEYAITSRQVFMPDLTAVLPTLPSRVGDRWRLSRAAAQALVSEKPTQGGEPLVGTLLEVSPAAKGADRTAVIGVAGRVALQAGETWLNARLVFTFRGDDPDDADDPADVIVNARGGITEVRLARTAAAPVPGSDGRLKATLTWELTLQRPLADPGEPLAVPSAPPTPDVSNAWLTYDDPKGRFRFRHPQDYLPQNLGPLADDDVVQLADARAGANDGRVVTIKLQTRTDDVQNDKNNRDPEFHVKELNEDWARTRQDVVKGPAEWLPDADWSPFKMRVFRIQAALKPGGPEARKLQRIYLDHYLVLFSQNDSLVVDAMTGQDPPTLFRQQVESILKTFELNPSNAAAPKPGP